ncbi:MAG: restriction endonuclease subunit S [Acidobacteria bacterium]|nr:restriction endonuclease subunit S [Acidobacteriota bacterium]
MGEVFAHPRLHAVPMRRVGLSESEIERFSVAKGDLLFARRSLVAEGAGKCCVVLDVDEPTAFESSIIRARPDATMSDALYLYYYFCSPSGLHRLDTIRRQVAVAGITGRDLSGLEIPAPPLAQQRAIARVLGTLDDKIELDQRMNATLEAMARALFKSWFVDFDPVRAKMEGRDTGLPNEIADLFPDRMVDSDVGEIPEGWALVPLPDLIEVNPSRSLRRGEIAPYLQMANMPTLGHAPDSADRRPFSSGMRFANGDTLVARITPCLENGKIAYVDFLRDEEIGWGSTEYIVMKPRHPLPSEFAYFLARTARFRKFAIQNMSGTSGRQRVPASALWGFSMPSPPEPIGKAFGRAAQLVLGRAKAAVDESRALANCRDALLPKLVSGQVRVKAAIGSLAPSHSGTNG